VSDDSFSLADEFESFGDELMGKSYEGRDIQMVVVKCETGTSAKGKHFIRPTLQFDGGPNSGKQVVDSLYWSPQSETAVRIFSQSLNVLGASPEWVKSEKPSMQQIAEKIKGATVIVNLTKDEFNGQPQTRVNYRKAVSAGGAGGSTGGGGGAASASAAAAVSLDDDEPAAGVGTPVAAVVPESSVPAPTPATTVAEVAPEAPSTDASPWD